MSLARIGVTLAAALLLGGCGAVGTIDEAPRVSLVHIQPEELQLFEQRYRVTLRVLNPNDAPLTIRGLSYEIDLNGKPFGNGVSGDPVTIPAFGEQTVSVVVLSNLARVYEQFRQYQDTKAARISYAIEGRLSVDGALGKIPFDFEGELDLGDLSGGAAAGTR